MDDSDRATQREEQLRAEAETFRYRILQPCGVCHWCETPVRSSALFCGVECRDDWQRDDAAKRRNGAY